MKILIPFILLIGFSLQAKAETHNMEQPIQIDGQFQRKLTPAEKLKKQREMLEARNEALVKKQIETLRLKQEIELMKKMQKAFEQNLENI